MTCAIDVDTISQYHLLHAFYFKEMGGGLTLCKFSNCARSIHLHHRPIFSGKTGGLRKNSNQYPSAIRFGESGISTEVAFPPCPRQLFS